MEVLFALGIELDEEFVVEEGVGAGGVGAGEVEVGFFRDLGGGEGVGIFPFCGGDDGAGGEGLDSN